MKTACSCMCINQVMQSSVAAAGLDHGELVKALTAKVSRAPSAFVLLLSKPCPRSDRLLPSPPGLLPVIETLDVCHPYI